MPVSKYPKERDNAVRDTALQAALRKARKIEDPWPRSTALASLAYGCTDPSKKNQILNESFLAALEMQEPNRIVTVSAWPLKVLCNSGQDTRVKVEVNRLLAILAGEPSPVRRADALNKMLGAILRGPRPVFWPVFEQFQKACLTRLENGKRNRRGESLLSRWVLVVDRFVSALRRELLRAI